MDMTLTHLRCLACHEGDGETLRPGSARSTDTVDVVLRVVRGIKVNHQALSNQNEPFTQRIS